jgi:hypothetical protein
MRPTTAWRLLLAAALCALALRAFPSVASAALPSAAAEDRWLEVRSARFRILSNADAHVATRVARHLGRLADVLGLTTQGLRVDGEREIRVYVFRDEAAFKPYRPPGDDELGGATVGFQASGEDVEHIAFFVPERQLPLDFASHEYLHAVLSRSLGEVPVWVNEGLAEFYSTFEAKRRSAEIGLPIPGNLACLKRGLIPLNVLLLLSTDSPEYHRGELRPTVYAQSWALVHALLMDPAGPERFGRVLAELKRGTPSPVALRAAYGPNAADSLERHLREYVGLMTMPARGLEFSDDFEEVPVAQRPLDRIEIQTLLGELLLYAGKERAPAAREHLEVAWSADTARVLPAALLGATAEQRGDHAAASRWFSSVQRSSGSDPRALGIAGSALAQRRLHSGEPFRWPASGADPDALQARSMLARALEGQPETAEWLIPYALTFLDDSVNVQEGIGALLQAQEDWPAHRPHRGPRGVEPPSREPERRPGHVWPDSAGGGPRLLARHRRQSHPAPDHGRGR